VNFSASAILGLHHGGGHLIFYFVLLNLNIMKTEIGSSAVHRNPKPKRGWSLWIEDGVWYTAPKISPRKFGKHAYFISKIRTGIRKCPCGCFMTRSDSGGPVDPFGACPMNPRKKRRQTVEQKDPT
jgi:hypothetical protein